MRPRLRLSSPPALALLAFATGALGCGASEPYASAIQPEPEPQPPALAAAPAPAGTFALSGRPTGDGCDGEVVLAARNIRVDPERGSLHADVVDRTYSARWDGERLVAEGRFDVRSACPNSTVFERWELRPSENGGLQGELASTWLRAPGCMQACTIRFAVQAAPRAATEVVAAGERDDRTACDRAQACCEAYIRALQPLMGTGAPAETACRGVSTVAEQPTARHACAQMIEGFRTSLEAAQRVVPDECLP